MINPNWIRWVKSSVVKFFYDRLNDTVHFYLEGQDRRTMQHRTYVEFRIDGPDIKEVSKNFWHLDIEINLLIATIRTESDLYEHDRNVGLVSSVFQSGIPVFCYGDTDSDDPTVQLGCLLLKADSNEKVVISNFGQVKDDSRMLQSTVEGCYRLELVTSS